jgi:hypothetical protein
LGIVIHQWLLYQDHCTTPLLTAGSAAQAIGKLSGQQLSVVPTAIQDDHLSMAKVVMADTRLHDILSYSTTSHTSSLLLYYFLSQCGHSNLNPKALRLS